MLNNDSKLNIIIFYDERSAHVGAITDHLYSFKKHSRHNIYYLLATHKADCKLSIEEADVLIMHYSVRINVQGHLSPLLAPRIKKFMGLKILFIQDEYNSVENARKSMDELGFQLVYTCIPEDEIEKVYPKNRFPQTEFIRQLTGYVPERLERGDFFVPHEKRPYHICYRGRDLPFWYGELGHEKQVIGERMREICDKRNIPCDIEWLTDKRIYGDGWHDFLASARATLGTESGSNVFDFNDEIKTKVLKALHDNPETSYETIYEKYVVQHDNFVYMNQISPKIFEAIALRTALILFEGEYSGIVKPDQHYISLKKDFSNADEVLNKLNDFSYIKKLTDCAYQDIIASRNYSYYKFVKQVEADIDVRVRLGKQSSTLLYETWRFNDLFKHALTKAMMFMVYTLNIKGLIKKLLALLPPYYADKAKYYLRSLWNKISCRA